MTGCFCFLLLLLLLPEACDDPWACASTLLVAKGILQLYTISASVLTAAQLYSANGARAEVRIGGLAEWEGGLEPMAGRPAPEADIVCGTQYYRHFELNEWGWGTSSVPTNLALRPLLSESVSASTSASTLGLQQQQQSIGEIQKGWHHLHDVAILVYTANSNGTQRTTLNSQHIYWISMPRQTACTVTHMFHTTRPLTKVYSSERYHHGLYSSVSVHERNLANHEKKLVPVSVWKAGFGTAQGAGLYHAGWAAPSRGNHQVGAEVLKRGAGLLAGVALGCQNRAARYYNRPCVRLQIYCKGRCLL